MFNIFSGPDVDEIKPQELEKKISGNKEVLILDVRKSSEFKKNSVDVDETQIFNCSSRKLLGGLPEEIEEKISDQQIIMVCYKGNISQKSAARLDSKLENKVMSLENGMKGWKNFR